MLTLIDDYDEHPPERPYRYTICPPTEHEIPRMPPATDLRETPSWP